MYSLCPAVSKWFPKVEFNFKKTEIISMPRINKMHAWACVFSKLKKVKFHEANFSAAICCGNMFYLQVFEGDSKTWNMLLQRNVTLNLSHASCCTIHFLTEHCCIKKMPLKALTCKITLISERDLYSVSCRPVRSGVFSILMEFSGNFVLSVMIVNPPSNKINWLI